MRHARYGIGTMVLIAGLSAVDAAPLVPSSELPGRQRERFEPSPLDRFMQPAKPAEPLLRWNCDDRNASRSKPRSRRNKDC